MARRYRKGAAASNGYRRARRNAAKLHKKGTRRNVHDTRVWAKRVVDNHQLIAVEGERIRAGVDDVRHSLPPCGVVVVRSEPEIPRLSAVGNR
jgi:hypothetical protein